MLPPPVFCLREFTDGDGMRWTEGGLRLGVDEGGRLRAYYVEAGFMVAEWRPDGVY